MKLLSGLCLIGVLGGQAFAQKTASDRLQAATEALTAMAQAGDKGIPQDLLKKAECVVVIPNLKKGGFIVGGGYGKGFTICGEADQRARSTPRSLLESIQ